MSERTTEGAMGMRARTLTLALTLAPLLLGGCLESGRGGKVGVTTDTTTVVTDCQDDGACDDGDPCTWDECVVQTGECKHWDAPYGAREAPYAECGGDAECDDGDPCTADRCDLGADGCGHAARCLHTAVADGGCAGCEQTGCDDGNPCTLDLCMDDGTCAFPPAEDCAYGCSGADVTTHATALYGWAPGAPAKLAGYIGHDLYNVCLDGDCECTGMPALLDGLGEQIALRPEPTTNGDDTAWYCRYDYCVNETPSCAPLQHGASYWVWGTIASRYAYAYADSAEYPGAPRPPTDVLNVWDYCLQTNAAGLVGRYVGTYTTFVYEDITFSLEAEIFVDASGQLKITLAEPDCPACGQSAIAELFPYTTAVDAGDGSISFSVPSPTICSAIMPPPVATLYSKKSVLAGVYHDPLVGRADPHYCAYGEIVLSRVP